MEREKSRQVTDLVEGPGTPLKRRVSEWPKRLPLMGAAAIRAFRRVAWLKLVLLVGLVVQAALVMLVWELVDLSIGLMEVWLELARKHLEITLS
jgi:hypothetical protein